MHLPAWRFGKPYESLERDTLVHFLTGEPVAEVSQVGVAIVGRDLQKAAQARRALLAIDPEEIVERLQTAGNLYANGTVTAGDTKQSPDDFVKQQSATTGLPESLCRANMQKNMFVLSNMDRILDALSRGLDTKVLWSGYGTEHRGVTVSYQAQSPVLGLVLPSNSPGVHTLWLPVIALGVGLVMKPGSQEPWTPYRMAAAMVEAGIPAEAIGLYPGATDVGAGVLAGCRRSMIFGSAKTVEQYRGNPGVQVHGPGFSKIILGDDCVDDWAAHLDMMCESVAINSGRGCINASAIYASRHTKEIAAALAERLGPIEVKLPDDPDAKLAAFTIPGAAKAIWGQIEGGLKAPGVTHATGRYGDRFVEGERCGWLRPTVVHCATPEPEIAKAEYMFPFVSVVECPQERMLDAIGPTLVCSAITSDATFRTQLVECTHIDRLNFGAIPTTKLDWLQPHEGNIIDFLYRSRALQMPAAAG
ncbi:MAG: aldehyde dehydrogenase family protein [Planctomycetota bacterium]|nr:MAG: aldehyde dehydrogenase family protein [Planctomycetota bacterium]